MVSLYSNIKTMHDPINIREKGVQSLSGNYVPKKIQYNCVLFELFARKLHFPQPPKNTKRSLCTICQDLAVPRPPSPHKKYSILKFFMHDWSGNRPFRKNRVHLRSLCTIYHKMAVLPKNMVHLGYVCTRYIS